jgi:hypothetical protein
MRVGDYRLLLLDAQRSARRVRAVWPNIVHVDVVEVGVYPHALAATTHMPALSIRLVFVVDQPSQQ